MRALEGLECVSASRGEYRAPPAWLASRTSDEHLGRCGASRCGEVE